MGGFVQTRQGKIHITTGLQYIVQGLEQSAQFFLVCRRWIHDIQLDLNALIHTCWLPRVSTAIFLLFPHSTARDISRLPTSKVWQLRNLLPNRILCYYRRRFIFLQFSIASACPSAVTFVLFFFPLFLSFDCWGKVESNEFRLTLFARLHVFRTRLISKCRSIFNLVPKCY